MRVRVLCLLLASAVPGLLFAPVFGLWPLVLPILAVLAAVYAVFELCTRVSALAAWRPMLAFLVGLLALAEAALFDTTLGGLPTGTTIRALVAGVTESWQLTLQSTWPVRPDAELLLFVPIVVLFVAVVGIELLRWPAWALVPSLVALVASQAFSAAAGLVATGAGLAYVLIAAGMLLERPRLVVPTIVLGVAAAVGVTAILQGRQPPYSVQQNQAAPAPLPRKVSPLSEVAAKLARPDTPVFSYTSDTQVDRWRVVVLTDFNGVTWTAPDQYRRLGAEIDAPAKIRTTKHSATVKLPAGDEPWVPSQATPASVTGAAPLIDPASGMLILRDRTGPVDYQLSWWEPELGPDDLATAALDSKVPTGGLGEVPAGITELARTATGNLRPSFESAIALEQYLSRNYDLVSGTVLPTGSGWPQLRDFLLDTKRGTSEQFAASYVALARIVGIPARIAVGYRSPRTAGETVVRNGDVLAWPEVAVAGVGWVPLDPTGSASTVGPATTRLAQATAKARAVLPPPEDRKDPPLPPSEAEGQVDDDTGIDLPVLPILFGVLGLLLVITLSVPVAKALRTFRRRRRTGTKGVVAAWSEARDLLRSHGTRVTPGMTPRDLARANTAPSVVDGLAVLAGKLDLALWSGAVANDDTVAEAWASVRTIRRGLADRPLSARIRAVFNPRSLSRR